VKSSAIRKLRQKLASDEPVYGLWVTLESASITEMAVALGLDWVVIDAEHGQLDWRDILEHIRATVRSDTVALVRLAEVNIGLIKRTLDIGADGVVVPWIESPEQLESAIRFAHYPPEGLRGIGAERATCWGHCFVEHVEEANEHVLVVPIIESVTGALNIERLLEVAGTELFYFGPADFSSTAGFPGQWEGPGVAAQILAAKDAIRAAGKHCGVVGTSNENLDERRDQGFRMLALGLDGGLLLRSIRGALAHLGRDRAMTPALEGATTAGAPPRPPEELRPDRPEMAGKPGIHPPVEIVPGVLFEVLAGSHNGADGLTSGLSTFHPNARLPYHRHPYAETLTLLSGELHIEVEGRIYALSPFDNISILSGLAHAAFNPSSREPAIVHAAVPTTHLERTLEDRFFSRRSMPADATGLAGAERVTRLANAQRAQIGPHAEYVDYCNGELMPGIEMSGGYAIVRSGGRINAHLHDLDEAATVVSGCARCFVEGRTYTVGADATMLFPRGRVHSFINEETEPTIMLLVYAGPHPSYLVVDGCYAEDDPWSQEAR
jgi:2-keto-3-deoxy-L-rhamnonate aldolase RhmA/quercetin dioxygenase-like cupin family protein